MKPSWVGKLSKFIESKRFMGAPAIYHIPNRRRSGQKNNKCPCPSIIENSLVLVQYLYCVLAWLTANLFIRLGCSAVVNNINSSSLNGLDKRVLNYDKYLKVIYVSFHSDFWWCSPLHKKFKFCVAIGFSVKALRVKERNEFWYHWLQSDIKVAKWKMKDSL